MGGNYFVKLISDGKDMYGKDKCGSYFFSICKGLSSWCHIYELHFVLEDGEIDIRPFVTCPYKGEEFHWATMFGIYELRLLVTFGSKCWSLLVVHYTC